MGQSLTLIQTAVGRMIDLRRPTVDDRYGTIALEGSLNGRRILVIEDDGDIRARLAECLGRERCIVETAPDGTEGLRMALAEPYDVVITDIKMPGLSGFEVFDRIRKAKPGQKVIMMTAFGYDEGHAIVRGNQHGLNGVLYKPFTPELLRKVLARVCQ
jgi:DNA-binding response OmpR family regulator